MAPITPYSPAVGSFGNCPRHNEYHIEPGIRRWLGDQDRQNLHTPDGFSVDLDTDGRSYQSTFIATWMTRPAFALVICPKLPDPTVALGGLK